MSTNTSTVPSTHPLLDRLESSGPKHILSLDGGGIRGALCIGILEKIESELKDRFKDSHPNFVLSDYYDMIGGTSTGAILATLLARGYQVKDVKELYLNMGSTIFSERVNFWRGNLEKLFNASSFKATHLEDALEKELLNMTLGSTELKTGLCIISKRSDTFSPWIFHNHPKGTYYDQNSGILLRDLLRATSAAPSYFTPKELHIGKNEVGVFIDGGVSSFNNPALILFYLCSLNHLPYKWNTGKDNMLITSIGTGFNRPKRDKNDILKRKIVSWAGDLPDLFMSDATTLNQLIMQSLAYTPTPQWINSEFGNLNGMSIVKDPLFTYQRYNVSLDINTLQSKMNKSYSKEKVMDLIEMSNGKNAHELYDIGVTFSKSIVDKEHFSAEFDLLYGHKKISVLTQENKVNICNWIKKDGWYYKKYKPIYARKASTITIVNSTTQSGFETVNTAQPGDYIVKNQTKASEEFTLPSDKFEKLYTYLRSFDNIWDEYLPIGQIYAVEISRNILNINNWPTHFYIDAAWGSKQYCTIGDYLVCPIDQSEFYTIGRQEFEQTYTLNK
jgi:patatin-like phospholipase/acyl hydrolase